MLIRGVGPSGKTYPIAVNESGMLALAGEVTINSTTENTAEIARLEEIRDRLPLVLGTEGGLKVEVVGDTGIESNALSVAITSNSTNYERGTSIDLRGFNYFSVVPIVISPSRRTERGSRPICQPVCIPVRHVQAILCPVLQRAYSVCRTIIWCSV